MKTIGILGGMGPEATANLYMAIVKKFQVDFGAKYDKDFPQIIINSIPIPDIVENHEEGIVQMLMEGVQTLESAGADFIIIACNTVHVFIKEMRNAVTIPILSIMEETNKVLMEKNLKTVGLLATETTVKNSLFIQNSITLILPSDQCTVTSIIMDILAGVAFAPARRQLQDIITTFKDQGAQAVILGCTDLHLLIMQEDSVLEFIDTTTILATTAVREALAQNYINTQTTN